MQYVDFKDGIKFSRLGYGALRFSEIVGENGEKSINEPMMIDIIRTAIDSGINFIDTAYIYEGSEVLLSKALSNGYREKVVLCSKLPIKNVTAKEDLERYFKEQCDRLQTDVIDIYLLHNLSKTSYEKALKYGAIEFMQKLKADGKVKYIGFSMHDDTEHLKMLVDKYPWDLVMLQYNYYDKYNQAGIEGVKYAASRGIAVVTMESLHGGMLTQNVPKAVEEAFGDWKKDASNAEKAFIWLYNQPEVKVILSSVKEKEYLIENLKTFENAKSGILSEEENALFDKARKAWSTFVNNECTACAYCMPCPMEVDIPEVFKHWNVLKRTSEQKWLYGSMLSSRGKDASKCIECGKCSPKCPQGIDIPKELKLAHQDLSH